MGTHVFRTHTLQTRAGSFSALTRVALCAAVGSLLLHACAAPLTPGQKAREAAQEYAVQIRFGRMDMAAERVGQSYRERFTQQHGTWGSGVRILDCELAGLSLRNRDHADTLLNIGWQRIDDTDVRSTQIIQHWQDEKGNWTLVGEDRNAGDVGLLGESNVVVERADRSGRTQFPSITIGGGGAER